MGKELQKVVQTQCQAGHFPGNWELAVDVKISGPAQRRSHGAGSVCLRKFFPLPTLLDGIRFAVNYQTETGP